MKEIMAYARNLLILHPHLSANEYIDPNKRRLFSQYLYTSLFNEQH